MQTHGGDAADDAITARERRIVPRLLVDWGRDGTFGHDLSDMSEYVSTAETDRALKGSVPEEMTLIEGSASAELTATVGGTYDGMSLVEVFSEYNGRSPFYLVDLVGVEVEYSLVVHTATGTVTYPQFAGVLREIAPDRASDSVELTCLDRAEMLREPIDLPPWAISEYHSQRGLVRAQLCDSQWVIDHCLRHCDVSPTGIRPTTRHELGVEPHWLDGVHFWLPATGSHVPSIGWVGNADEQSFPDTEGGEGEMFAFAAPRHPDLAASEQQALAFNSLGEPASGGVTLRYWVADRDLMDPSATFYMRATLNLAGDNPDYHNTANTTVLRVRLGANREIALRIAAGEAYTEYRNKNNDPDTVFESTRFAIPTDEGDHIELYAQWDNTQQSGTRVYFACGNTDTAGWEDVGPGFDSDTAPADDLKGLVTVNHRVSLTDVAFATRNMYSTSPDERWQLQRDARYAAVLDPGRNRMTFLPERQGVDAWDIITDVAAAEFGSVFWDENGVFRFWNYDTILSKQDTIVRTFTTDDVTNLQPRSSLDSVRNIWTVEAGKKVATRGTVYDSQSIEEFYLPSGEWSSFRIWVNDVQMASPFALDKHTSFDTGFPLWGDDVVGGYCIQYYKDGQWQEDGNRIDSTPPISYFDVEGYLIVKMYNGWGEAARFATDDDQAALRVPGTKIVERDTLTFSDRYPDSIDIYGPRNIRLSGDWYQDRYQSEGMLDSLATRSTKPVPVTEQITIPGDPRLQLGDTLATRDPDGIGELLHTQLFGSRRAWSVEAGLSEQLTVELIRPPGDGIWDSDQYGRWNETLIWG